MNYFNKSHFSQNQIVQKHFRIKVNVVLPTVDSGRYNDLDNTNIELRQRQMIDDLDFLFLTKTLLRYV